MKRIFLVAIGALLLSAQTARADLVEEEPDFTDNTGALGVSTDAATSVDIIKDVDANGMKDGEITIKKTSGVGVDVFSGLAKVEAIPEGSDGWTGSLVVNSDEILYTPAGRPQLSCPAQSLAGWYGPCKIKESSASN